MDKFGKKWQEAERLKENNRARNEKYRRLHLKLPPKSEHYLSQAKLSRINQISFIKPKIGEYAEYPTIAQQISELHGCKFLINKTFCNQARLKGKPYCQYHNDVCYIRLKSEENIPITKG